ncbi:MAG: Lon protease family protein, partial [Solirubrobacteraceae bacterium]
AELPFATTAEVEAADGMSSQPRVADALDLSLRIETTGYNVFATGPARAGKLLVLEEELRRRAASRPAPPDRVYLFDFESPARPAAVALPTGRGPELARDVAALVEEARSGIRVAFESDSYRRRHGDVHERIDTQRQKVLAELQAKAREHEVALELTPAGVMSSPLVDGRPVDAAGFEQLTPEQQAKYHESVTKLETIVAAAFARLRALEREERDEHRTLDREVALFAIGHLVEEVTRRWEGVERVGAWLAALCDDLVGHLPLLRRDAPEPAEPRPLAAAREDGAERRSPLSRYEVNVLVTHDPEAGAPVVAVYDGSYHELFGRIEYWNELGAAVTDHRHIRAGAVHRAAGGYLLLRAEDVLTTPFAWPRLKELLRTGQARIENLGTQYMLFPSASLDPEPIDAPLTVVMTGSSQLYQVLCGADEDVRRLFKVRADFDAEMTWDATGVAAYAAFVARQARELELPDFDAAAVARIVEHGARLAEHRERLSTCFPELADLAAEAGRRASHEGAATVGAAHVDDALRARRRQSDLPEQRLRELTLEGALRADVTGSVTGQVNGLAVADLGDHRFGHPVRVTATAGPGQGRVIDIDREAELSGPIHTKGILILAGLLRERYCRETPLALHASIVFEQSYGGVEGDSASAAELLALLSALAEVPVAQRIAVTGSIDQHGAIQAVGGVNEKIEGFFALCRERGLTGDQGVAIPATNLPNLMLAPDVVDAVADGRFHVWAISTVDEALQLLTGIPAGRPGPDGSYPEASVHGRVHARITALAALARDFGHPAPAETR